METAGQPVSTAAAVPCTLAGGVVAFNEAENLDRSVRSLIEQELPDGWSWGTIWLVVSGSTDGTGAIADQLAASFPAVRVLHERDRGGKARALNQILSRSRGQSLVLLNGDAVARPGAVAALLEASRGHERPFGVMAFPVLPLGRPDLTSRMIRLLWTVHHELHRRALGSGSGNHLSDELLMVSLPSIPMLPEEAINDGSFIGAWLRTNGGERLYAPASRVEIEVPGNVRDHLQQRRRITVGHAQARAAFGAPVTTFPNFALRQPREAAEIVRDSLRHNDEDWWALLLLITTEIGARMLSIWDRLPPRRDHQHWVRIRRHPDPRASKRPTSP